MGDLSPKWPFRLGRNETKTRPWLKALDPSRFGEAKPLNVVPVDMATSVATHEQPQNCVCLVALTQGFDGLLKFDRGPKLSFADGFNSDPNTKSVLQAWGPLSLCWSWPHLMAVPDPLVVHMLEQKNLGWCLPLKFFLANLQNTASV